MLTLMEDIDSASRCCNATILMSRGDGVMMGTCARCDETVCRLNPRTGRAEWLNGESPWTTSDASVVSKRGGQDGST